MMDLTRLIHHEMRLRRSPLHAIILFFLIFLVIQADHKGYSFLSPCWPERPTRIVAQQQHQQQKLHQSNHQNVYCSITATSRFSTSTRLNLVESQTSSTITETLDVTDTRDIGSIGWVTYGTEQASNVGINNDDQNNGPDYFSFNGTTFPLIDEPAQHEELHDFSNHCHNIELGFVGTTNVLEQSSMESVTVVANNDIDIVVTTATSSSSREELAIDDKCKREGDRPTNDNRQQEEPAKQEEEEEEKGEKKARRLAQAAKAAALLPRKVSGPNGSSGRKKDTSVGPRRVGSAIKKVRGNDGSFTRLVDAVRTGSSAIPQSKEQTQPPTVKKPGTSNVAAEINNQSRMPGRDVSARVSRAMIEATVDHMLKPTGPTMGLLGEAMMEPDTISVQKPRPGTLLLKSPIALNRYSSYSSSGDVNVRVATPIDDIDIANLRLSVFSNFSYETRKVFCDRSCHLLESRRRRGATCIIATNPKQQPTFLSSGGKNSIVGTAEISFHEFAQTSLGRARPKDSILYVTEVAVNPTFRRKGIANLMLQAIDKVAKIRNVETIYLHVDVTNFGALRLYERGGYNKLPADNPVYAEFTKTLNLHDGATKGRNHYLMAKDLRPPTWLWDVTNHDQVIFSTPTDRGTLGIEVTA